MIDKPPGISQNWVLNWPNEWLSLFQSKLKSMPLWNETIYSEKPIPAAAPLVTINVTLWALPSSFPQQLPKWFSKTYICFTLSWIDGRVQSTLIGLSPRAPSLLLVSTPHSFLDPLHYSCNEDLPFQWDLLLHHFSLKVLITSSCFGEIFIFKIYLNNSTGFHVAFKANQSYPVLI